MITGASHANICDKNEYERNRAEALRACMHEKSEIPTALPLPAARIAYCPTSQNDLGWNSKHEKSEIPNPTLQPAARIAYFPTSQNSSEREQKTNKFGLSGAQRRA